MSKVPARHIIQTQAYNFHVCRDCFNHHSRVRNVQKELSTHITEFSTHVGSGIHSWYSLTFHLILHFSHNFISMIQRPPDLQNLYLLILLTNADLIVLIRKFSTHPTHSRLEKDLDTIWIFYFRVRLPSQWPQSVCGSENIIWMTSTRLQIHVLFP